MKTYVINLEQDRNRRWRMEQTLASHAELVVDFVPAVDGRMMSDEELARSFDQDAAFRYYGRYLMKGEIGCTLSHIRCYHRMLMQNEKSVLILEDDIEFSSVVKPQIDFKMLQQYLLTTKKPTIVLLSGHFWHWPGFSNMKRVYAAYYTHAYAINLLAARLLVDQFVYPWHLADNWIYFRQKGINVLGIRPHWINQLSTETNSSVLDYGASNKTRILRKKDISKSRLMNYYKEKLIQRGLAYIGCYEKD